MPSGGSTTVQKADPWSGAQPYLKDLYGNAAALGNNPTPAYGYQNFANFTPLQRAGQSDTLNYAQRRFMPGTYGYQDQLARYMQSPLNITRDPAVQNMMRANANQVNRQLSESWLPQIRSGAAMAGQYGGSRQGIAEGQAIGRAADALSNANAQTALGAYGTASSLAGNAAGQMPGALQMGFTGPQTAMSIGAGDQSMYQSRINQAMGNWQYPQQAMTQGLNLQNQVLSGIPWGSETKGPGSSPAAGILGGAATGAGIAGGLSSAGLLPAGSPWGWGLMGASALLGAM